MADRADERLKEVHQSDLTEGRINEDFLDWLKTKGTSWLLVFVIALFAYAAMVRWRNYRENYHAEAWAQLEKASLPSSYEDVAEKYGDVGAIGRIARLRAAGLLIGAVQSGKTLGADTEAITDLTEESRKDYLDRADRLYAKVVESDDQSPAMTLLTFAAINGRAAVAESRGDLDAARTFYKQAATRAEGEYPKLAQKALDHAANAADQAQPVTLPTRADIAALQQKQGLPPQLDPVWTEPWVTQLVMPN